MKGLLRILLSALFLSFAWPVRGQFGHMEGALIPGAMAAAAVCILIQSESWRKVFAQAVILSALGFSIGGDFGYGKLIDSILASPDLWKMKKELLEIFLIGAVWGGLGSTLLGFGLAEKKLDFKDHAVFSVLGVGWWISISLFKLDQYNLIIYGVGALALHLYNELMKRSAFPRLFGWFGFLGFGLGLVVSVIILYFGNHGKIPGHWWSLRDQIWGAFGGSALMLAALIAAGKNLTPQILDNSKIQRYGFIFYAVFIPLIETYNVFEKWFMSQPPIQEKIWPAVFMAACLGSFIFILIVLLGEDKEIYEGQALNQTLYRSTVFFMAYLSLQAILKSIVYSGWAVWETAFTLFIMETLFLSFVSGWYLKYKEPETI